MDLQNTSLVTSHSFGTIYICAENCADEDITRNSVVKFIKEGGLHFREPRQLLFGARAGPSSAACGLRLGGGVGAPASARD
ncbi:hypothetical protein GN956_G17205 [Arapaima gigas]